MFDTLGEEIFCSFCGAKIEKDEFQTKNLSDMLTSWTFKELIVVFDKPEDERKQVHFYSNCKNCGKWNTIILKIWEMKKW